MIQRSCAKQFYDDKYVQEGQGPSVRVFESAPKRSNGKLFSTLFWHHINS